jgi:hypothetical protein
VGGTHPVVAARLERKQDGAARNGRRREFCRRERVSGGGLVPVLQTRSAWTPWKGAWVYTLVRRFIKTGVGFLALGLAIGLYMLVQREVFGIWPHPLVRSAHVHAVFGGFVMFLILGVALWLFPRADKADRRYRPGRIQAAYWILAVTTFIRVAGEMARAWQAGAGLRWLVVAAGVGQVAGFALYFYTMWGRIRPVGSHLREAKGERF